jgi:glutamyl-tRNA synthetase
MFPLNWHDERTGESYIGYRESGFFPDAFVNMLAMLGWNPGTTQEIFSMEELIEAFSLERVHKAGAKFDPEKTKWFNQQYLRKKPDAELAELFKPLLEGKLKETPYALPSPNSRLLTPNYIQGVCKLVKEKSHFVNEFWDAGKYFFIAPSTYDADVIKKRWNDQSKSFIQAVTTAFKTLNTFTAAETEAAFKATAEVQGIATGQVMQLFRVCLSGVGGGPMLFEMVELLGKEEVLKRLETAVATIKG